MHGEREGASPHQPTAEPAFDRHGNVTVKADEGALQGLAVLAEIVPRGGPSEGPHGVAGASGGGRLLRSL